VSTISTFLDAAEEFLEVGRKWAKKGYVVAAFHEISEAEGILKTIAWGIVAHKIKLSTAEGERFIMLFDRFEVLYGIAFNGQRNPDERTLKSIRDIAHESIREIRDLKYRIARM